MAFGAQRPPRNGRDHGLRGQALRGDSYLLQGVHPRTPHLADKGELASPNVVAIQPEGEDGGQCQGAAHSSQIIQVGLGVLDITRAEVGVGRGQGGESRINLFSRGSAPQCRQGLPKLSHG